MIQLEKNGHVARIEEMGAEMREYCTKDGRQRLWSGNPEVWAGVSPVLFPVIGNLKNQSVRIGGTAYEFPKHGFAKISRFQLVAQGADFCRLVLEDTPETQKMYPFSFRLTITHQLLENGFSTEYRVENLGKDTMPFTIGGHTGFACPMKEGETFSDYRVLFEKEEEGRNLLYAPGNIMGGTEIVDLGADHRTLTLNYETYDQKDTLVFAGLNSRSVKLVHKDTGKGLRLSFPDSTVLAIWTKPHANAPYICLEPWNGLPALEDETGNFEDKPYHIALDAGKSFALRQRVEILD